MNAPAAFMGNYLFWKCFSVLFSRNAPMPGTGISCGKCGYYGRALQGEPVPPGYKPGLILA